MAATTLPLQSWYLNRDQAKSPSNPRGFINQHSGPGNSSPISVTSSSSMPTLAAGVPQPTADELVGKTYLEWIKTWDDNQVAKWLNDNRCGTHAQVFASNDIRGEVLLDVDQQALKEMGVQSVGDRVKITVAVKKLRQACISASATAALASRRPVASSSSPSSLAVNGQLNSPASPTYSVGPGSAVVSQAQIARKVSLGKGAHRIPPPLHLHSSSVTDASSPQAYQSSHTVSPAVVTSGSSANLATYGARTSSNAAGATLLSAPSVNAPARMTSSPRTNGTLPQSSKNQSTQQAGQRGPASSQPPGTRQHQQLGAPAISTTSASPAPGLQAGVSADYNSNAANRNRPRPTAAGISQYTHKKSESTGGSISSVAGFSHPFANTAQNSIRPSTSQGSYGQHPFAAAGTSPTSDGFMSSSGSGTSLSSSNSGGIHRSASVAGTMPRAHGSFGLSPITETLSSDSAYHAEKVQQQAQAYKSSAASRPSTASTITASPQVMPLEDVMRKTVKFIGEDGVSKMVNVDNAKDVYEILLRALRKFGKLGSNSLPSSNASTKMRNEYDEVYAELDGFGVYATLSDGTSKALTEGELLMICQSASRPERTRGLILRRLHVSPSSPGQARSAKSKKLRNFFGEDVSKNALSPTSPTNMLDMTIPSTSAEPTSPTPSSPLTDDDKSLTAPTPPQKPRQARNTMNRASTVSILSSLNWGTSSSQSTNKGSPSTGFINSHHQKLKNFFGQRPPSELISTHLVDYFPTAPNEKKILSKTVRQNVRKSMMRRESSYGPVGGSAGKTSWDASRDSQNLQSLGISRFSVSSLGSTHRGSIDTVPPLPTKDNASAISRFSDDYDMSPNGRPRLQSQASTPSITPSINVDSDEDDGADAQSMRSNATRRTTKKERPSSRLSIWSQTRSNRDSDNASLLTVEEITEDLEKRRLSRASWTPEHASGLANIGDAGGDGSDSDAAASSQLDVSGSSIHHSDLTDDDAIIEEQEEEEEEDEEEEGHEEEEEEEEEEEDTPADVPQTVTTTTKKSTFRWVKGALIGSGSFGQVYLGMNAANGSFMAVKQVELPTGNSHNEERKKSMLSALEREIELLKTIQHSNIVQYLDSSSDGKHLHIFLEYVPGGSVAHLLSNYGAFEETLVRTFVKQILQGLAYLHENDIIHRDIKGANILVDNRGGIKISDFGISKKVEENLLSSAARLHRPSLQGSVFWMAPEVVKQTSYTAKADIWSLGCLVVEMFTGHHPWMELTQMQAIFKIGSAKDARPADPPDISPEATAFLADAFKMDHNERPTAAALLKHEFVIQDWTPPTPKTEA